MCSRYPPVQWHVEEVGHEGDLGDGGPHAPGEEVIDDATVSPDTGEGDPGEHQTPAELPHCLHCPLLLDVIERVDVVNTVGAIHQTEGCQEDKWPDGQVGQGTEVNLDILGHMKDVAHHQSHQVALIPNILVTLFLLSYIYI